MWTLNSRRSIQLAHSAGHNTSSTEGRSGGLSGRRTGVSGPSGGRGVELGTMGLSGVQRIQVRTQVQTLHHTDSVVFGQDDTKAKGMEEVSIDGEDASTRKA